MKEKCNLYRGDTLIEAAKCILQKNVSLTNKKNAANVMMLLILQKLPEKEAIMKENSVLSVNLGDVLLRDADVAGAMRVHRLLLALQHKLLMVHLSNFHLFML